MARRIGAQRNMGSTIGVPTDIPGIQVDTQAFWVPCRGIDYRISLSRLDKAFLAQVTNMRLNAGRAESRTPVAPIGGVSAALNVVVKFVTGAGVGTLFRFAPWFVQYYNGASWVTLTLSPVANGVAGDRFMVTSYNDTMLFTNGKDGIYKYDPTTGDVSVIAGSFPGKFITTFAGRVIVADVRDPNRQAQRIRWSVKNDSDDWEGVGSGYEDLLSTPGGAVDQQLGVHPVTDNRALLVRTKSIWLMSTTGLVDQPFRFDRLFNNIGTDSPYSWTSVPGGVVGLGTDDVYLVSPSQFQRIGNPVKDQILANASDIGDIVGAYNSDDEEYLMLVKEGSAYFVYAYSFLDDKGWMRRQYTNGAPVWITHARSALRGTTIDELVGTIDEQVGSIDELGLTTDSENGVIMCQGTYVVQEDSGQTQDNWGTGAADAAIELRTGLITAGTPLHRSKLIEAKIEYEAGIGQTLIVEYTNDAGGSWTQFGENIVISGATAGPTIARVRSTVIGHNLQVRVRSTTLGTLKLHGLFLRVVAESEVQI